MVLSIYKKEDAPIIAEWLRSEEELYKWSADRFNKYPLSGKDINENYAPQIETGRFIPLTAVNDGGEVVGHFIIRYPHDDDDRSVRFGFVIIDPALRGKGYGKELLRLGIEYVKENLNATRIDLGVFENNESARHCYEAVGFTEYAQRKCEMPIGIWNCADMELFIKRTTYMTNDKRRSYVIRSLRKSETELLKDFLYEAIFIPEGVEPPAKDIIEKPELRVYTDDFGSRKGDYCLVADFAGKVVGAVWTRIMNDYGHVDDETPSFAISLHKEYRRQGIGSQLMVKMLELLKWEGYDRASLAVQKANYAVKMYKKVGFDIVEENAEEYIMVCEL